MRPMFTGLPLALACVLAGCDQKAPTPDTTAPGPLPAAIAKGSVGIEGGLLEIFSQRDGVFDAVNVSAGQSVHRGELLAHIDDHAARLALDLAQSELAQAKAQANALSARQPALHKAAERWREAAHLGAAQEQQADAAALAELQLESDLNVANAGIALAEQKVRQAEHEVSLAALVAPVDADVVKVAVQPGSFTSLGDHHPALTLLPHRPLQVRAEVNEGFVAHVKTGQHAQVTLEASPDAAPYAATVSRISPVMEAGSLSDDPQSSRVFECILQFDKNATPDRPAPRIGQTVLVKFND